jgi:hypothetical protein
MIPLMHSPAADWVVAGTDHWKLTIEGFVPAPYEAYARVLHEIESNDGRKNWASVAAANSRPFGPLAQWTRINVLQTADLEVFEVSPGDTLAIS